MFYVIEGHGTLFINNKAQPFQKNFIGLWPSGTEYYWDFEKESKCRLAIINFDYTCDFSKTKQKIPLINTSKSVKGSLLKSDDFTDAVSLNTPLFFENMHFLKQETLNIIDEFESQKIYSTQLASSMLKPLIIKLIRYVSLPTPTNLKIEPIFEYIKENYSKEITNTTLASITNYHPYYVNTLIKNYTGTSLHSYLINFRLNEATKMLINTSDSIETIALKAGFKNPTHFSATFKKKYGVTPSLYRQASKTI
ncbi:MAG: helix-turn-helix transcriptional regulator [Clostridia bacterium]|nr:helix-turn-helix transcriptional regulator [Clostridia bacterium]